jgi:succinate dehydrogenase / fumarate reductase cytochrome b subunit
MDSLEQSFWDRHSFAIRRLHSLSGLIPVGGYMVIHLAVNASVLNSDASFQSNVANIHKFGNLLPVLEWTLIFIPILFHAIVGVAIVAGGLPNTHNYPYGANYRYTLQRVTGVIAFFFIMLHVFHMHGWFHGQWWMEYVVGPLGGGQFKPYNATSTAGEALKPITVTIVYLVGVLACVFHLANGIWTMGITWGLWVTPAAQRRADYVAIVFGLGLAVVGVMAEVGMLRVKPPQAKHEEDEFYKTGVAAGTILPDEHKRSSEHPTDVAANTEDAATDQVRPASSSDEEK